MSSAAEGPRGATGASLWAPPQASPSCPAACQWPRRSWRRRTTRWSWDLRPRTTGSRWRPGRSSWWCPNGWRCEPDRCPPVSICPPAERFCPAGGRRGLLPPRPGLRPAADRRRESGRQAGLPLLQEDQRRRGGGELPGDGRRRRHHLRRGRR